MTRMKSSAFSRLNKNDDGYIFMMAILVFVLLSATTMVILGATQNQLTQTTQNRQFTETRQGITAAVNDALNTLNNTGYATAMTNVNVSTKKNGTAAKSSWWWYFDVATNTINASATAHGKTRTETAKVDYSDVASTRDGSNGLPIYSVSAFGAWKDAVSFNASSTGALTVTGNIGLYGSAKFNTAGSTVAGSLASISHDDRTGGVLSTVTKTRDAVTTVLDERTNKAIAATCSTWNGVFSGGTVNTSDTSISCYTGFNVTSATTISGSGVKTIVIRESSGNHNLAANVTNLNGGQLHVIFAKRTVNRELVIGSTASTPAVSGLFVYAPNMECSSIGQGVVLSGSLVCDRLTNFKSTINWLSPKLWANDGVTRRIWFQAP